MCTLHVVLAPFVVPRELSRLRTWLARAHVAPWWGDPDEALTAAQCHSSSAHALITVGGEPVGYVCWQRVAQEELVAAGLDGLPLDLMDVDILIGETDMLGRGVGPKALGLVLSRLRAEGVAFAGIACAKANPRARRAYEKAGFQWVADFRDGARDMCYLIQDLTAAA